MKKFQSKPQRIWGTTDKLIKNLLTKMNGEKGQSSLKKNTNKGILTLFNVKIFYKKCLISLRKLFSVYMTM